MKPSKIRESIIVLLVICFSLIGIFIIFPFYSCNGNKLKSNCFCDEDESINKEADSIFTVLEYYFSHNPDSAIIVADEVENKFIADKNNSRLVQLYSYLSEVYQYRKRDDFKALSYILKAMDIMTNNPDLKFDKTYLYINIGNILYHYELYNEAIYIYREVPEIMSSEITPGIKTLIYNNIGLSFQEAENYDSARYYFLKAEKIIENTGKARLLLKIQNINYLASLDLELGNMDMIVEYYSKIEYLFGVLDKAYTICNNPEVRELKEDTWVEYYSNKIRSKMFMVEYYIHFGDIEASLELLNDAANCARVIDDKYWLSQIYARLGEINFEEKNYEKANIYLDSVISLTADEGIEYQLLSKVYLLKSNIGLELGSREESEKYKLISEEYLDSLNIEKNSFDVVHGKIELAFRPVQLAITNVKLSRNEKIKTIQNQKRIIFVLAILLCIIVVSFVIYYRLNSKLNKARKYLALRTIENLKTDRKSKTVQKIIKDDVASEILKSIEEEIVNKKAYLDANLNLTSVADKLQTNRSYISKIINSVYEKNFNDYINELRIKEACYIIYNNTKPNFTIDHLFSEVGFTSKSTFYSAFKKYAGVTPALFFKLNNRIENEVQ
ncbi:MAG: helix-turn-helix domain-containing protein [Bacteroidales bacterium]|nr:helix-turn-helix domain-containing protein [Bacteroidales bacterium]